jgi:hypothetical protein
MSTRERVRVMREWFGRRQTIALPINSVVGCLIATILLMILSENNVRTPRQRHSRQRPWNCAPRCAWPGFGVIRASGTRRAELLAPVCGWFTEGFDTRDLIEAKKLLDELSS